MHVFRLTGASTLKVLRLTDYGPEVITLRDPNSMYQWREWHCRQHWGTVLRTAQPIPPTKTLGRRA